MRIRAALALPLSAVLVSCVGNIATPTASPATAPPASATAGASPAPSAAVRQLRPFERVVPVAIPGDPPYVAPDRERVAYVGADGALSVVEVGTGQTRKVHSPQQGWYLELDPHGLRGDLLVFRETRTDGQRTDARIVKVDLRTGLATTVDDFAGPFLGGGDTWRARAPITNGSDILWVRVDDSERPFLVSVGFVRGAAAPAVLSTGSSAVWIDLDDTGRVLISTLITPDQVAELVVWREGQRTPIATRPSGDGGPAVFVAGRIFWAIGPGIVRPISRGALIDAGGVSQTIDLDCGLFGNTVRYLAIGCMSGGPGVTLVDGATGDRIVTAFGRHAGGRAVAWPEATQWWLGILPP